jgi:AP-1-like transcription factor
MYGDNVAEYLRNAYPVQDPVTAASMGLIPVELDIDGLYETQDRRRKKSTGDKAVPPHVHSVRTDRISERSISHFH